MTNSNRKGFTCPRCGVGRCQPTVATFVDTFADSILSIPNVPAYICDVCHFAEFEQSAIELLWDKIQLEDYNDEFPHLTGQDHSSSFGE